MTGKHVMILGSAFFSLGLLLGSCTTPAPEGGGGGGPQATGPETAASAKKVAGKAEGQTPQGQVPPLFLLDAQKRAFLKEVHLKNARRLADALKYEDAKAELLKAKEVAPDDPQVNKLLSFVLAQLGERPASTATRGEAMTQEYRARLEKLKLEAMAAYEEARNHLKYKEYDKAIQKLREVQMHIHYGDAVNWGDLKGKVNSLLAKAQADKAKEMEARRVRLEEETFRKLREAEAVAQARKAAQIHTIWKEAIKKWVSEDYEDASRLAEEILALDPTHQPARKLHDLAQKALKERNNRDYIRRRREEFRKWTDNLAETKIPYSEILVKPSKSYWKDITEKRKFRSELGLSETVDPATQALEKKLETERVRGTFPEATPFADAVNHLVTVTGLPVVLTKEASDQIDQDSTEVQLNLPVPVTARSFLDLLMKLNENLTYVIQDGVILITTKEKAVGNKVVRVHDISDLAFGLTNFAAPKIDTMRIGEEGGGGEEEVGPMGGPVGEPVKTVDPEELVQMIKDTIAPGTWESPGVSLTTVGNQLVVVHTPEVQRKVIDFLNELRRYATSIVTIDTKFLTVSENWLHEMGVEWRGLGGEGEQAPDRGRWGREAQLDDVTNGLDDNASRGFDNSGTGTSTDPAAHPTAGFFYDDGLDGDVRARTENIFGSTLGSLLSTSGGATIGVTILDDAQMHFLVRMVEKSASFQLVNSQTLTVMNTQRANVTMVQQISYVKDFEVEVAQASYIADPQVDVLQDGIVLDVKPTISYDRKYITLELRPTVAELQQPIPTFQTSLAGATLAVTMQLPELRVRTVNTTVKVPDGGSVLIGGLKEILNHERKAEVPWLANLPIVSLFFKTQGQADENQTLMILVKAWITDVAEAMANR